MFNNKDFINWAQTAQNDNKPMQDFRSSHFNPMNQVQQQEDAVQIEEENEIDEGWGAVGKGLLSVAKSVAKSKLGKKVLKRSGEAVIVGAGNKAIDAVGDKLKPKPIEPVTSEHASYKSRKEAGMRAIQELIGPSGISKKNIKKRADQSGEAYGHGTERPFKFGRKV